MDATDLCYTPATTLAALIARREVSPVEVIDALLERIQQLNPRLNAYVAVMADEARQAAQAAEQAVARGDALGRLHGVPVSIKDLINVRGVRTTRGTKIFERYVPDEDAPLVERLRAAGAIVVGKTNTPALGWTGWTDNLLFGPTRNPWNLERTPGGSSGGASAAVAAGLGPLAVGTDGGGSIRIPAAFAGCFGIKASWGLVPQYPASAVYSISHAGPMTRTVRDAAVMLQVMAGPDDRDRVSLPALGQDYLRACEGGIQGLRVAWSPDLGYARVDPEVRAAAAAAAGAFIELGCEVEEASPGFDSPEEAWMTLFYGGIAAALEPYLPEWADRIDLPLLRIVEQAGKLSAPAVGRAEFTRLAVWDKVRAFFERYDLLLTPATAVPAFPVGQEAPQAIDGQPISPAGWTPFTFPFNLTGQPAASVPCGWTSDGLPIGLQVVGPRFGEERVFRACAAFEEAHPWADARPPLD